VLIRTKGAAPLHSGIVKSGSAFSTKAVTNAFYTYSRDDIFEISITNPARSTCLFALL